MRRHLTLRYSRRCPGQIGLWRNILGEEALLGALERWDGGSYMVQKLLGQHRVELAINVHGSLRIESSPGIVYWLQRSVYEALGPWPLKY